MPLSKLYTDDTGRLPIRARSGNQYITIAYHKLSNVILCAPFANRSDAHRLAAYNSIMHRLTKRGLTVDLQILDNEASKDFKANIEDKWKAKYQLVPPDVHRRNAAERAIQTFKSHFLAIIADLPPAFPRYLWDLLLPQTELTLNLLRQSSVTPSMSAWEHFNGPFDYNATPLLPLGCPVIIHNKPSTRRSWDFRGSDGFYVGVSLEHYRCHRVIDAKTKALRISDTVDFRHHHLTIPTVTPADTIVHSLDAITNAISNTPSTTSDAQLHAISTLRDLFSQWEAPLTNPPPPPPRPPPTIWSPNPPSPQPFLAPAREPTAEPTVSPSPTHRLLPNLKPGRPPGLPRVCHTPKKVNFNLPPAPRVAAPIAQPKVNFTLTPAPRVETPTPIAQRTRSHLPPASHPVHVPISSRTRSHAANAVTPAHASSRRYPSSFITNWANTAFTNHWASSVRDDTTGNFLEWRQLRTHPLLSATWNTSYSNELGRLCQGIGTGPHDGKRVKGTNTLFPIQHDNIPFGRRKEITYSKVVCKVRPEKGDAANRTRITIGGNNIAYPGDVGTPTGSLELVKLLINSVLSQREARFATFDLKDFYLNTPLDRPEYVRIKITDIPEEFIKEYTLKEFVRDGWVYFEMRRGMYGLPQAGILANNLLRERLAKFDYYEAATTPGLWRHKWRPIMFALIVDNFAIQYVGDANLDHLRRALKQHYEVSEELNGTRFAGITLKWHYSATHSERTCRTSMPGYINNVLVKFNHPMPTKRQLSPHKHREIVYGQSTKIAHTEPYSPPLSNDGVKRIQGIIGALLYYARAVDNKLLATLSTLGSQQATATEATAEAVSQLLDYLATYPDDGTTYHSSDMILCAHADAGFHNESKGRSRAGAHIFMSENDPFPRHNGPILSISQILKFVMSSAAEAELGALYTAAKELVPLRQTLDEMGWPQPRTPIQTDNSTAVGVTNLTIVPRKTKAMDLRLWWLRCREAQEQFRFYWDKGSRNLADYHTKHHPPIYHESNRPTHAGAATQQLRGLIRAYAHTSNSPPHASSASQFQAFLEANAHAYTRPQPP